MNISIVIPNVVRDLLDSYEIPRLCLGMTRTGL